MKKLKKKLITFTMVACMALTSIPVWAGTTTFDVSKGSYTGIAKKVDAGSYYTVTYHLYGNKVASNMSCQVIWTTANGGISKSAADTKANSNDLKGSKSNGPKNSYKSAVVIYSVTYNGKTKQSSATAF